MAAFEDAQGFDRERVLPDAFRVRRHDLADFPRENGQVAVDAAAEIAVGEDAEQRAVRIRHDRAAAAGGGHAKKCGFHVVVRGDDRDVFACAHQVADAERHGASDRAAGVPHAVVFPGEIARLQQDHGEGVADRELGGGRGGRGEIERAGFAFHVCRDHDVGEAGERGVRHAGDACHRDAEAFRGHDDAREFVRFAAVAQCDHQVAVLKHAQVAVHGFHRVHEDGRRTGAGERGGYLPPHVAALADSGHHDLAVAVQRVHAGGNELHEPVAELVAHGGETFDFDVEHLPRLCDHGFRVHFHSRFPWFSFRFISSIYIETTQNASLFRLFPKLFSASAVLMKKQSPIEKRTNKKTGAEKRPDTVLRRYPAGNQVAD